MLSAAILLLLGASGAVTVVALLHVQRRRQQAPDARCEAARRWSNSIFGRRYGRGSGDSGSVENKFFGRLLEPGRLRDFGARSLRSMRWGLCSSPARKPQQLLDSAGDAQREQRRNGIPYLL